MDKNYLADAVTTHKQGMITSYRTALSHYRTRQRLARISWVTWIITIITIFCWCITTYQTAWNTGAHSLQAILTNVIDNAVNVQPASDDALTNVLIQYGAKYNEAIVHGQYWRFITPIFLHANLLHVGLNMLNFIILGVFLERIMGHARFLFVYILTGAISTIASFAFAPDVVSVGASGAIFGLVGAYSVFVLVHRHAFHQGGIPTLFWLLSVIGINLGLGFVLPNVDNYAHTGGLLSGCLLGWWFMPLYRLSATQKLVDTHRLARRWPLALLTILGTLLLALIAITLIGTRS